MIELFIDLITNKVIVAVLIACLFTQFLKPIIEFFKSHKFDSKLFLSSGHMPSSHTASISALAASFYVLEGLSSAFIISLVISVVIFLDATRLRMAVGKNIETLKKLTKSKEVNELAGHTVPEAVIGVVLGVIIAVTVQILYLI